MLILPFIMAMACDGVTIYGPGGDCLSGDCPEECADEGGGDCEPEPEPDVDGEWLSCDGVPSQIEVLSDDAAGEWGVTDYAFESGSTSLAGMADFIPVPFIDSDEDGDSWNEPESWPLAALPGVVSFEQGGLEFAAVFGRVCCPAEVLDGGNAGFPVNGTCNSPGPALNGSLDAWCIPVGGAGLCVHPCDTDTDCPSPPGEFCDFTTPDPNGSAPGTCQYKSMPSTPTPVEDIDGLTNPWTWSTGQ